MAQLSTLEVLELLDEDIDVGDEIFCEGSDEEFECEDEIEDEVVKSLSVKMKLRITWMKTVKNLIICR